MELLKMNKKRMAHRKLLFAAVEKRNVCVQTKERVLFVVSFKRSEKKWIWMRLTNDVSVVQDFYFSPIFT